MLLNLDINKPRFNNVFLLSKNPELTKNRLLSQTLLIVLFAKPVNAQEV